MKASLSWDAAIARAADFIYLFCNFDNISYVKLFFQHRGSWKRFASKTLYVVLKLDRIQEQITTRAIHNPR